jgi:hypothetical protein
LKQLINHRFGVEIELNSFDGLSKNDDSNQPSGIKHAAEIARSCLDESVDVTFWHTTINSSKWLVKPDSSCGIEVCSPILKGNNGLKSLKKVINAFKNDGRFTSDSRCSFHVHFELPSQDIDYLSSLIVYWMKCELFFYLLVPNIRKQNRYCQLMGMSDIFPDKVTLDKNLIFNKVSDYKFYSLSLYHFKKSNRNTVEFRIMDSSACLDADVAESWILLLNSFINKIRKFTIFDKNGLLTEPLVWLNACDVIDFLKINKDKKLMNFITKRIKKFSTNEKLLSLNIFKKIFNFYFDDTLKYLEFLEKNK